MAYIEKTIDVPGFTLALKIWNEHCPKPVLCLHGKMDSAASFDFLAPLLPERQIIAVDFPGTGYSSHYSEGVLPSWKNDAYLMLHLIDALGLNSFDIIAHSLGSLIATMIGITKPKQVEKIVYLDILGPTYNFIEQKINYLLSDVDTYLSINSKRRTIFPSQQAAIQDRMRIGNISYTAAEAFVIRGTALNENGWYWTFDRRLRCVSSTLPCEDELRQMFYALKKTVCLIRANQGVKYPQDLFNCRVQCFHDLIIKDVQGGHHVHMDNPSPVASLISQFFQ